MPTNKDNTIDAKSFKQTQRIQRILHNRDVKKWFRDIISDTAYKTGREQLKTAYLINKDDSGIEVLNKILGYQLYVKKLEGISAVASVPEVWNYKPGIDRPQLAIIFRPKRKTDGQGYYPIYIPHYDGDKTPRIKAYTKGNYWAKAICKDNSQLIINGKTEAIALARLKDLIKLVAVKYRPDTEQIKQGKYSGKIYKEIDMIPYRADFYKKGKTQNYPDWQYYF